MAGKRRIGSPTLDHALATQARAKKLGVSVTVIRTRDNATMGQRELPIIAY